MTQKKKDQQKKTYPQMRKHTLQYTLEDIDSTRLRFVDDYQKPLDEKRVAQIVAEFDDNIVNEPKVSFRNDKYFVFDGQHTVAALIMKNNNRPLKITYKVYHDLTVEDEAFLFAEQTGFSAKPTPGYRLRALLFAKDEESLAFKDATEGAGFILDLDGVRGEHHIKCIKPTLTQEQFLSVIADQPELAIVFLKKIEIIGEK